MGTVTSASADDIMMARDVMRNDSVVFFALRDLVFVLPLGVSFAAVPADASLFSSKCFQQSRGTTGTLPCERIDCVGYRTGTIYIEGTTLVGR